MRASGLVLLSLGVLGSLGSGALVAQTAVSADGQIESTSGGFKFPDGSLQATAAATGAPVEDTGQTTCWDATGASRPCTGTGEDGEYMAGAVWPTPRFNDNGDGTVTDQLTQLTWMKDANCPGTTLTWQAALDWVKNPLNSGGTACGDYVAGTFSHWRLPNIKELLSLLDYSQYGPALPSGHPFAGVQSSLYWSSTTNVNTPSIAWGTYMDSGNAGTLPKSNFRYVWPVKGGQ